MRAIVQFRDVDYYQAPVGHEDVTEVTTNVGVILVHQVEGTTFYPLDVIAHVTVIR